ncbi:MAG: NAD-dependent epimerase/dehydratase family protein [Xanthobacteraceae bacterium]|jgi:nucleoside-diphosphate-sugar epimerase
MIAAPDATASPCVVVTGARGYFGSALVKRLAGEGHALRLVSRSAAARSGEANATIENIQADLRGEASWHELLKDAKAIVHLSSRTDLRAAEADPTGDYDLNVEPVRALVRAGERRGIPVPVVFASAVTIVGDAHANPVNEQTPDRPRSVYDRHKLECETILRDATRRGVLRACSLRLPNVYGYGVSSVNSNRGILNGMMRRAAQGEALTLYGDGAYVRDFIFVSDVVDAFCRTLTSDRVFDGGHYVIATGRGHTLAQAFSLVAQEAFRHTGRNVEIRHVPEPSDLHPIERRSFVGDASLFRKLTGWQAQVDLESGIRDYFKRWAAGSQTASAPHEAA